MSELASAPCPRHPQAIAREVCARCGDFTCDECARRTSAGIVCIACEARIGDDANAIPPGSKADLDGVFQATLRAFPAIAIPGFLLDVVPSVAWGLLGQLIGNAVQAAVTPGLPKPPDELIVIAAVLVFPATWLQLRAQVGTILMARAALFGRPVPGPLAAFGLASGRVWPLFAANFAISFAIVGCAFAIGLGFGLIAAIAGPIVVALLALVALPVIIGVLVVLALRLVVLGPVVVLERRPWVEVLTRCWVLARGHALTTFLLLIGFFVAVVALLVPPTLLIGPPFGFLTSEPYVAAAILGVPNTVAGVAGAAFTTSLYYGYRAAEPGKAA